MNDDHRQLSVSRLAVPGAGAGRGRLRHPPAADRRSRAGVAARDAAGPRRVPRRAAVDRRVAPARRRARRPGCCFRAPSCPGHERRGTWSRWKRPASRSASGRWRPASAARGCTCAGRRAADGRWRPTSPIRCSCRSCSSPSRPDCWRRAFTAGDRSGRRSRWRRTRRRCCTGGPCRRSSSTCRSWSACTSSRPSPRSRALPATRLAVLPLALAHRALAGAGRALSAAARPVRAWVQRRPAAWLWPDHEVRWVGAPRADGPARPPGGKAAPRWPVLGHGPGAAAKPTRSKAV